MEEKNKTQRRISSFRPSPSSKGSELKEEKKDCPLCGISDETIERLRRAKEKIKKEDKQEGD